jgi:hypothetical protein
MWRRGTYNDSPLLKADISSVGGGGTGFQAEKGSIPGAWRLGPWIKKKIGGRNIGPGRASYYCMLHLAKVQKFKSSSALRSK